MKEAIVFVPGFDAKRQNYYLEQFLEPGLLAQLEDLQIRLDPEAIKIPGQTGKRFYCQLGDTEKTVDIFEVYWMDLIDRLSSKELKQKFSRGLYMIFYWFTDGWKIMTISPAFFIQIGIVLVLVMAWYYGIVILILTAISQQASLRSVDFLKDFLGVVKTWSTEGHGWQVWIIISALLAMLPMSINLIIDLTDFIIGYVKNESSQGKPPIAALLKNRVKNSLNNVVQEGSYERITVLAHSLGVVITTDCLANYNPKTLKLRYVTWGAALESLSSVADWIKVQISKCIDNASIENWEDYYSNQDWICSKVPVTSNGVATKVVSKHVSFKVSLAKQISGDSHMEYFFDAKVLRHLIWG